MSSIKAEQKRKRSAPKPALSSRKRKRAAAYHSSSSSDEAEPLRNKETAQKILSVTNQAESATSNEDGGIQLPNLQGTDAQKDDAEIVMEEREDGSEDDEDVSLGSEVDDDEEEESEEDSEEDTSVADASKSSCKKSKRHDPEVFANSMQRILNSKLTSTKRSDPVLSRSAAAQQASRTQTEQKLDKAARRKLRADKKAESEKGRDQDVLGLGREDASTGEVIEMEKMLKRTAQRGVVKLFNAVRAAQMGGLQAEKEAQDEERKIVGIDSRKRKVDEMSKQGFLDLLASGKAGG